MASKDTSIVAQTAAKAAAELYHGTGDIENMAKAMVRIFNGIIHLGGNPDEFTSAERNLREGGVSYTVQRDLSSEKGRWEDALINNPDDWYNNVGDPRATSGGGTGPDFKFKDKDANVKPLYLNGKYGPAPAWVWERLGLQMPNGQQVQPQAQPEAPEQGNPVPF